MFLRFLMMDCEVVGEREDLLLMRDLDRVRRWSEARILELKPGVRDVRVSLDIEVIE